MPRKAKELGPLDVKRLTQPGFHFVGGVGGLALQVLPTGSRSWVLRVMVAGKRRNMGLGGYPDVTLAGARIAAREQRLIISNGGDPIAARRKARLALIVELGKATTFKAGATAYIAANEATWGNDKHRYQWSATLETYAYPFIGSKAVAALTIGDILEVLNPIWSTKTETAKRLRGRIETVIDFVTVESGLDIRNPARWRGHLDKVLAAPRKIAKVEHYPALPWKLIPDFMQTLKGVKGSAARALEFLILTVVRSGPIRRALWTEIDLDAAVWIIPEDHMKIKREHRVPLAPAAIELLKALPRLTVPANRDYVFPSARSNMLWDMAMGMLIRELNEPVAKWVDGKGDVAVPHGFRSTFRDWVSDATNHSGEVAEMILAHAVKNETEAAYFRSTLFNKRIPVMKDWAKYCYSKPD